MTEQGYTGMSYRFLKTTWHFPDGDDCYEEIDQGTCCITLIEALKLMIDWLHEHPFAVVDEIDPCFGVMECCDPIDNHQQKSARIECER